MIQYKQFPNYISVLTQDFNRAVENFPESEITKLAESLMKGAMLLDHKKGHNLPIHFKYDVDMRDIIDPPEFEHAEILKADWADKTQNPLGKTEKWNHGRRATATGQKYKLDNRGRPVNPYMNTGINGRGILGAFGPNHAVDNGTIIIRKDEDGEIALYSVLGILRKYDDNAPALAGGFAKYAEGQIDAMDFDAMAQNQMEEFFEEVISGSVELLPKFEKMIPERLHDILDPYDKIDQEFHDQKEAEVIATLKLEQVAECDPGFLKRLKAHILSGHECFAGPVMNDSRNTNTAWIESRLSWAVFDEDTWANIKGEDMFGYDFKGGDDASDIVFHKFNPETVKKAFASHGPMMCFMTASYLLDCQERGIEVERSVINQIEGVAAYLKSEADGYFFDFRDMLKPRI